MLFTNIVQFDGKVKRVLAVTAVQAVEIIVISYVVSLPFTLQFDSMFKGVGIAQNHSMIHQLLILWGLPVVLTVLLIICIIWEKLRGGANRSLYKLMKAISVTGSVCDCHGTLCNRADRDSGVGLCKRYLRKWKRQGEYYV